MQIVVITGSPRKRGNSFAMTGHLPVKLKNWGIACVSLIQRL